jgi:hypothetical protein
MSEQQYLEKSKTARATAADAAPAQTAPLNIQRLEAGDLQRMVGNQQTQRLLAQRQPERKGSRFIQAKLTVGAANDVYEQEADRVADRVMTAPETPVQREAEEEEMGAAMRIQREGEEDEMMAKRIQREGEEDEMMAKRIQREGEEDEMMAKRIQRAGDGTDMMGSFDVDENVEKTIDSSRGKGQPMPDEARGFFENRMGYDFSNVNIHTGGSADNVNRSIQAKAFTTGSDIFFRDGAYNPGTSDGKELLAHELTHVVQQGGAAPATAQPERDDR